MTDPIVPPVPDLAATQEIRVDAKSIDSAAAAADAASPVPEATPAAESAPQTEKAPTEEKKTLEEHAFDFEHGHQECRFCRGKGSRQVLVQGKQQNVKCGGCNGRGRVHGWAYHAIKTLRGWGIGHQVTTTEFAAAHKELLSIRIGW